MKLGRAIVYAGFLERTEQAEPTSRAFMRANSSRAAADLNGVVRLSLKLGFTAFGGPAAHIAMLEREVVHARKWMPAQHFLQLLGLTNLLPGPNSTEMVMYVGRERAGWRGLVAGGLGFILPACSISLLLAIAYDRYGARPNVTNFLYGLEPVIIAVIVNAVWRLGRISVRSPVDGICIAAIALLYAADWPELPLLFAGGLVIWALRSGILQRSSSHLALSNPYLATGAVLASTAAATTTYSGWKLFWSFLKIGALLYGSGYVLVAFIRSRFVEDLGWMTDQQLLDAIAAGQITPGPVFSTATFVGYLVGGLNGAALATIAIFLPAFLFVGLASPLLPRIQRRPHLSGILDGISVAALGLMLGVAWLLTRQVVEDLTTVTIAFVAIAVLVLRNSNPAWLMIAGGIAGLAVKSF
jgi:chromate transporter